MASARRMTGLPVIIFFLLLAGPLPAARAGFVYQDFEPDNGSERYGWSDNARSGFAPAGEARRFTGRQSWKVQADEYWPITGIQARREPGDTNLHPDRNDRLTFWIRAVPDAGQDAAGLKVTHNNVGVRFFDTGTYSRDGFEVWTSSRATYQKWTRLQVLFSQLPPDFDLAHLNKIEFKNYWPGLYYFDDIRVKLEDRVYQSFDDPYLDQYGWVWNESDKAGLSEAGEPVYSGRHSWKMELKGSWGGGGFKSQDQKYNLDSEGNPEQTFWQVDLNPDQNDRLTLWVYSLAENGLDNNIGVQFYDHGQHSTDDTKAVVWTPARAVYGQWTKLTVLFSELPASLNLRDINKIQLQFYWPGTYYIDDIRAARELPVIDREKLANGVLSWSPVEGAAEYLVDKSVSGPNGPWQRIAETRKSRLELARIIPAWYRVGWKEKSTAEQPLNYFSDFTESRAFEPRLVFISRGPLERGLIRWNELPGATDYQVQEADSPQGPWHLIHDGPLPYEPLAARPAGWYRVRALRRAGNKIEQAAGWSRPQARDLVKGFLRVSGQSINTRNGLGEPIVLQGVNLGNLFLLEPEFLGIGGDFTPAVSGDDDDFGIRSIMRQRFGSDDLLASFQKAYIQGADIDRLVAMGANFVRLPISFEQIRDRNGRWTRFEQIDRVIKLCADRGLYVLLDLHGAPGRQSKEGHSGRKDFNRLFEDSPQGKNFRQQTINLWRAIARRYKDNPAVAGYDLLNEPFGALDHDPGLTASNGLWALYHALYESIREIDPHHIIVMEAVPSQLDWDTLPNPREYGWQNVVYQFHYYGFLFDEEKEIAGVMDPEEYLLYIQDKIANSRQPEFDVPVLVGEFNGFDQRANWKNLLEAFSSRGWSWSSWTYKSHPDLGNWGLMVHDFYDEADVDVSTDSSDDLARKFSRFRTNGYFSPNISLTGIMSCFFSRPPTGFGIVINEVRVSSPAKAPGKSGDDEGWFELKNISGSPVNLQGFVMTSNSRSRVFPDHVLDAMGHVLVRLVRAPGQNQAGEVSFADFTIDPAGDNLTLRDPLGAVVDRVNTGTMEINKSRGRFPDGLGRFTDLNHSTPGRINKK